ncbi:MAG: PKD domain-containing protein [Dehalococcoidia bacterium]
MNKAVPCISILLVCCLLMGTIGVAGCGGGGGSIEVTVDAPADGAAFEEFSPVRFTGTAFDKDEIPIMGESLVWESSIDGEIGTGATVTSSDLSAGSHTITFTAMDSEGDTASESISIKVNLATGIIPRGGDYLGGNIYRAEVIWNAVTVRDDNGNDILGLELDDFTVKGSIETAAGESVTEPQTVDITAQIDSKWKEGWFWEESLGDEKLDIVFLIENRGTMKNAMPDIKSGVYEFVDRLMENHIDFRMAAVGVDVTPDIGNIMEFHGPAELDKLREGIESVFRTAGTWWSPVAVYDCLLLTPWLGFREDARKVVISITDIPPQTIYGTFWYPVSCTAATRSAVELFLENNPDIELYYCLNPDDNVDYHLYYKKEINPMAGDGLNKDGLGSGWGALESRGYATGLRAAPEAAPWPFDQSLIRLTETEVSDSKYYFVWEPDFDWKTWNEIEHEPEDYLFRTTIEVTLPATGETLTATMDYPIVKNKSKLSLNYIDDRGEPVPERWVHFYLDYPISGRVIRYRPHMPLQDGAFAGEPFAGTYILTTRDRGSESFDYQSLRVIDRRTIEVPAEGIDLELTVSMAEREMWLVMARGLLKDLRDNWRQPGDPFLAFVSEAEAWLDQLEQEGIGFREMTQIRRFLVTLSGYANMVEYGQQEIEKSIQNVEEIVDDIADIIAEVGELHDSTRFDWQAALGILLEIAYDVVTRGEFTAKKIAIEEGLDALIEYASTELIDDLNELVCKELPDNDYKELLCALVEVTSRLPEAAENGDWSVILEPLQKLAFQVAIDQVTNLVADNFVEAVFDDLDLSDQLQKDLKGFVKDILTAMTSETGFDNFDKVMERFVENVIQHAGEQYFADNREDFVAAIEAIFDKLRDAADEELGRSEAASFVNGFLIGMAEDLAMAALPTVKDNGAIKYEPNGDALVSVLIEHTLYHLFLKECFVDEVTVGLHSALSNARSFVPEQEDYYDWEKAMHRDFRDYRSNMRDLQRTAWDALETQDDINNWATALDALGGILKPLGVALEFMGTIYPPMKDTAEEVDTFVDVLDGIQIVSTAIEFGLRVDSLETFGDITEELSLTAFGKHEE